MTVDDLFSGYHDGEWYPQVVDLRDRLGAEAVVRLEYGSDGVRISAHWRGLDAGIALTEAQARQTAYKNAVVEQLAAALERAVRSRQTAVPTVAKGSENGGHA